MIVPRPKLILSLAALYAGTLGLAAIFTTADRLLLSAAIAIPLIWLTITDLERQEIPDLATATIALAGAVFQWHLHGPTISLLLTLAIATALTGSFWLAGALYFRRHGVEALGIGDAKLIGAGTLCIGATSVWAMLLLAATGGITAALLSRRSDPGSQGIAFGPFLAYSVFILVNVPVQGLALP